VKLTVDLTTSDGVEAVYDRTRGRDIAVLALNAGIAARSDDLTRELEPIDLNVEASILCRAARRTSLPSSQARLVGRRR